ncbi:MAG: hypothetical protein EKK37_11260 [Sphingobacteriales bacterium]|nr:MAG: hypothetical protein EKK37_11260 [Sphingobacteriales bacterium]
MGNSAKITAHQYNFARKENDSDKKSHHRGYSFYYTITQLFTETIETINSKDYNEKQVKVWSAGYAYTDRWIKRLIINILLLPLLMRLFPALVPLTRMGI